MFCIESAISLTCSYGVNESIAVPSSLPNIRVPGLADLRKGFAAGRWPVDRVCSCRTI